MRQITIILQKKNKKENTITLLYINDYIVNQSHKLTTKCKKNSGDQNLTLKKTNNTQKNQ